MVSRKRGLAARRSRSFGPSAVRACPERSEGMTSSRLLLTAAGRFYKGSDGRRPTSAIRRRSAGVRARSRSSRAALNASEADGIRSNMPRSTRCRNSDLPRVSHGVAPNRLSRHRDRRELQVQRCAQFLRKAPSCIDVVNHDFDVRGPRAPQELHAPGVSRERP